MKEKEKQKQAQQDEEKKGNIDLSIRSSTAEYLTYVASIGENQLPFEVRYEDENIWLTQRMMAELYGVSIAAINQHLNAIYRDLELTKQATIKKYLIVQNEGNREVSREINHYNLQAIIAVGFKVNNERAVQFRKWANQIVKDYTIQGWVMDVERLKNFGSILNIDYFEKQLEKVREIRLSERFSIKRLQIFTQPPWTMIKMQKSPDVFLQLSKISCIMLFTAIRQQKSFMTVQIVKKKIWD